MALRPRFDVRLATQVLLLQVAVVVLTLGIAGGLLAFFSHSGSRLRSALVRSTWLGWWRSHPRFGQTSRASTTPGCHRARRSPMNSPTVNCSSSRRRFRSGQTCYSW